MTSDGCLHSSIEVVGAIGQEDDGALGILRSILAVHHVENVDETACVASLHEVPVALTVKACLGSIHNLHGVDVHLATTLHLQRQRTSFTFVAIDSRTTIAVSNAGESRQLSLALLHNNTRAGTILTQCHSDGCLRTYKQVNGIAILESPSMLCVVPVEALASGIEGLMVFSIEILVGQVEEILLVSASRLHLGLYSVQLRVGGNDVSRCKLLAQHVLLEPATSLVAVLRGRSLVDVVGKRTDGGVFLYLLRSQYRAVNTDILQRIVGLEDDVQHVIHLRIASGHGDGHRAGIIFLVVGNLAYGTSRSDDIGQRIFLPDHLLSLRQFQRSFILLTEHVLDSIGVTIDLERSEYGNILLGTVQNTLNDDVCQTNLLASLQMVKEEFQSA